MYDTGISNQEVFSIVVSSFLKCAETEEEINTIKEDMIKIIKTSSNK